MTITQPVDKTLTKERIEAILIALNHHFENMAIPAAAMRTLLSSLDAMSNLKGRFMLLETGEIVFVAQ